MSFILRLIEILTGLNALAGSARATLEAAKQNGEMTPEEEAAYDALIAAEMKNPWWKKSDAPTPPT